MARITVEDCLENVENRFELVMVGSKRARQLAVEGRAALLDEENDKPTVLALREIAEGLIDASILSVVDEVVDEDVVDWSGKDSGGFLPTPSVLVLFTAFALAAIGGRNSRLEL